MLISTINITQEKTQAENPEKNKNTGLRDKLLPDMNHLFRKIIQLLQGIKVSRFGIIHLLRLIKVSRFGIIHLLSLIKISFWKIFSQFITPLTRRFLLTDYNPQY